jgi:hypothetical protein
MRTKRRHPNADWPWWKIIGAGFFSFGLFGFIIAIMPPRTALAFVMGVTLTIVAIVVGIWNWRTYSWASQMAASGIWTLPFLIIGIRAWMEVYPIVWVYPIVIVYLLAWFLPALNPALSKLIWREQTAPQTRIGRIILVLAISMAPVAGALGASAGMFSSRFNGISGVYMIAGPLSFVVAIIVAQGFAHQLWPDRSWARHEAEDQGSP